MSTYKIGSVHRSHGGDGGVVLDMPESVPDAVRAEFARLVQSVRPSSDSTVSAGAG